MDKKPWREGEAREEDQCKVCARQGSAFGGRGDGVSGSCSYTANRRSLWSLKTPPDWRGQNVPNGEGVPLRSAYFSTNGSSSATGLWRGELAAVPLPHLADNRVEDNNIMQKMCSAGLPYLHADAYFGNRNIMPSGWLAHPAARGCLHRFY